MGKAKDRFIEDFRDSLTSYLKEKTNYGELLPNASFENLPVQEFYIKPDIWDEFPIPIAFKVNSTFGIKLKDQRPESHNPKTYTFAIYDIIGKFVENHFDFDFAKSKCINKTIYPNH